MLSTLVSHFLLAAMAVLTLACQRDVVKIFPKADETPAATPSPTGTDVPVDKGIVRLTARNVFKEGETKVNRVDISAIPNAPAIARIYQPSNENYRIITGAVATEVAAVIKVNSESEAEFKKVRILRLEANDMYPSGFAWHDCTAEAKDRPKPANDRSEQDYLKQFETYLPDYENRTVSCLFDRTREGEEQYFIVVSQVDAIPSNAFTKIKAEFAGVEKQQESDESVYILSVSNQGPKTAAEVNFISHFDYDTEVISTESSNGRCQPSRYGSSRGSIVCYLGTLAPGEKVSVRFRSKPSTNSGRPGPHKANNENWFGYGFARELESDGYWPANSFKFGRQ